MKTQNPLQFRIPEIERPTTLSDEFVVTVLVSTYESEEFMCGCLEDLVQQTLFKKGAVEVLVIDSGSPQTERAIVERFQKQYPNIVYVRTEREPLYTACGIVEFAWPAAVI